ncbi:MAG: VOC family protein [Pseudomonadota bacterium]
MSSSIIPVIRYHDAPAMIDWLVEAFGLTRHLVVEDGSGGIAHAQLTFGGSMIMLGSAREDSFGALQETAQSLGGCSQSCYLLAADVDALCRRAAKAGAEIVVEPRDEDYGGRGFSCRDPEGQLWNFGSYDPWANHEAG